MRIDKASLDCGAFLFLGIIYYGTYYKGEIKGENKITLLFNSDLEININ